MLPIMSLFLGVGAYRYYEKCEERRREGIQNYDNLIKMAKLAGEHKKKEQDNLLYVIKQNDLPKVKELIRNGADINQVKDCQFFDSADMRYHTWWKIEESPLTMAIRERNLDIVRELIKSGVEYKKVDYKDPLSSAILDRNDEMISEIANIAPKSSIEEALKKPYISENAKKILNAKLTRLEVNTLSTNSNNINNLPNYMEKPDNTSTVIYNIKECPICLDEYDEKSDRKIILLNCGHSLHEQCNKCDKCPICRQIIK